SEPPGNSDTQSSNSAIIKPTAHISTSEPNFIVPKSNSGDRCYLVTTSCDINPDGEPKKFAKPKSAIFKTPRLSLNKLLVFINSNTEQILGLFETYSSNDSNNSVTCECLTS
ncbi:unnamed protein product, partial [Rotaria sp. Silwood1]